MSLAQTRASVVRRVVGKMLCIRLVGSVGLLAVLDAKNVRSRSGLVLGLLGHNIQNHSIVLHQQPVHLACLSFCAPSPVPHHKRSTHPHPTTEMHATQLPAPCSSRPQLLQPHHRPLLSPGSHSLTTSSRRWTQQCQAAPVFEPQVDTQALTAQLLVLGVTAGTAAYW